MIDNEYERLKIVRQFAELDFGNSKELRDIVMLATEICKVPIAMITLMDEDVQLIKVVTGVEMSSNTRENSFCQYLVNSSEVMVVPDASNDQRFYSNPVVTDLGIRFYAGAPLVTESGYHLGTLCIFDQKPRAFSERQKEMLAILSRQVINLMELKIGLLKIEEQKEKADLSERKLRAFFNNSESCHVLIGTDLQILDFNKSTMSFVNRQYQKKMSIGSNIMNFVSDSYKSNFTYCFNRAIKGRRTTKEVQVNYGNGKSIWWNISFIPVKDEEGKITGVGCNASDITEIKRYIDEITLKNSSLAKIAYIHSHEYRKPVASIIGLMQLIASDKNEPKKEYLQMMELAVRELDEKIKSVVHSSSLRVRKSESPEVRSPQWLMI